MGLDNRNQDTQVDKIGSSNASSDHFAQVLKVVGIGRLLEGPLADPEVVLKTLESGMAVHTGIFDGHRRPFTSNNPLSRHQNGVSCFQRVCVLADGIELSSTSFIHCDCPASSLCICATTTCGSVVFPPKSSVIVEAPAY